MRVRPMNRTLAGLGLGGLLMTMTLMRRANRLPDRRAPAAEHKRYSDTGLSRAVKSATSCHQGLSGLQLLADAADAFAARVLLIHAAEATLDLQYYIWHGDCSGTLMLEAVHQAAERGVRVRLLLDDNGIAGLDTILSALDRHPLIEIRLFNPFRIRFPKALGFVFDFARLNRRMHNKSLTADSAVTVIGGRNIGDEYFGAGDGGLFADLDVLAIGPAVGDVARDFERYWNSEAAYPAAQILRPVSAEKTRRLGRRASIVERDEAARTYVERVRSLPLVSALLAGTLDLVWAPVSMLSDPPEKALGTASPDDLLAPGLASAIGTPRRELKVIAGYFVPGDAVVDELCALSEAGVRVDVLTNSYAANDVALVHAGYAPARERLLAAGVRLFEVCGKGRSHRERRKASRLGVGSTLRGSGSGSVAALRSGASTLHAKTFVVDRERVFIGSFNLDPRSIELNTELGFVIDSPALAGQLADTFNIAAPRMAYEVRQSADRLEWVERDDAGGTIHRAEPDMTIADHMLIAIGKRLPIRWLL